MSDQLELRLAALVQELDLPAAPDLVAPTLARLPDRNVATRPRIRRIRRSVAVALAAVLLLGGAAFAIAPSRHAILDVLGLRGVRIERVPRVPAGLPRRPTGLGQRIPVHSARHAAGFTALAPSRVTAAYVDRGIPGGRITLVAGRLLITEFRARAIPVIYKLIAAGTRHRQLRIRGGAAVYLFGAPSELLVLESDGAARTVRVRRAGNVLIWQRGAVTILVEGTRTLHEARAVARSLR